MSGRLSRRACFRHGTVVLGGLICKRLQATQSGAWVRLPDLPQALGGQFAGVHGAALIVAGGSYFPVPRSAGGTKKWVDTVYVLEHPKATWQSFQLPHPLGYGGSVSADRGLLLAGGSNAESHFRDCIWLRWTGRDIEISAAPSLPVPLANCYATRIADRAYVVGGAQSPKSTDASAAVYSIGLKEGADTWIAEAPIPAPGRILPSVASASGSLYVAGGASLFADPNGAPKRRYLRDAWSWEPKKGWQPLPDLPELTCAAPACTFANQVWVLGGSDGSLDARELELGDRHPGFRRSARVFETGAGKWSDALPLPFSLVTTTATVWNGMLLVPGGEDRPAHRSAQVHAYMFRGDLA